MDGIEKDLGARARVVRLRGRSEFGRELARQFDVRGTPATLVFDRAGELVYRHAGMPPRERVVRAAVGAAG